MLRHRATSSDIVFKDETVHKKIKRFFNLNVYEREVYWLKRLSHLDFVPKLYSTDDDSQTIVMENVGTLMTDKTLVPHDFEKQLDEILKQLIANNCQHNDLNVQNFLVKNEKLYLIDFGWSTYVNDLIENKNDENFNIICSSNLKKFPRVLNLKNRKSEKEFDDGFTLEVIKKDLKDYCETGSLVQRV
jgi:tRNA A-37 threonylcarbamoyl transferase component Bud32